MKMELWIRSQDKEDLIKADNLGLAYRGKYNFMDKIGDIDNYCICQFIDDYHVKLGTYKTKERALEVLDEIQNIIYINKLFNADINAFQESLKIEGYTEKEIAQALKTISTYEMPKE